VYPFQFEQPEPLIFLKPKLEVGLRVEIRNQLSHSAEALAVYFGEEKVHTSIPTACFLKRLGQSFILPTRTARKCLKKNFLT
jgi:hypothetical protein